MLPGRSASVLSVASSSVYHWRGIRTIGGWLRAVLASPGIPAPVVCGWTGDVGRGVVLAVATNVVGRCFLSFIRPSVVGSEQARCRPIAASQPSLMRLSDCW